MNCIDGVFIMQNARILCLCLLGMISFNKRHQGTMLHISTRPGSIRCYGYWRRLAYRSHQKTTAMHIVDRPFKRRYHSYHVSPNGPCAKRCGIKAQTTNNSTI
jgi:hypothetical protein